MTQACHPIPVSRRMTRRKLRSDMAAAATAAGRSIAAGSATARSIARTIPGCRAPGRLSGNSLSSHSPHISARVRKKLCATGSLSATACGQRRAWRIISRMTGLATRMRTRSPASATASGAK
ncbi:hypothetical protein ASE22_23710 [Sphingomonas sp. Root720]|nr:hypothetical protein ASE22_23710 [Sphingomonas sp. Root720]